MAGKEKMKKKEYCCQLQINKPAFTMPRLHFTSWTIIVSWYKPEQPQRNYPCLPAKVLLLSKSFQMESLKYFS